MKESIRARLKQAAAHLGEAPLPEPPAPLQLSPEEALALFARRFAESGGSVELAGSAKDLRARILAHCQGLPGVAISPLLPARLRPELPELPPEQAPLAISVAWAAVAETGTLLLASQEGRRLQLLAPAHLVLVERARVVASLSILEEVRSGAALGLHSGPSRSADIGGITVVGVHGPGQVTALVSSGRRAPGKATG